MVERKRGSFYLGGVVDPHSEAVAADPAADPLLYDARDLVTHGVIVGMTGSGKTGLGIDLLEEALLSGIPALVLDPKGDMTNLLLTFPELRPEDFLPWVNEGDARRKGLSVEEFAAATATTWTDGLGSWGLGPDRIRELKAAARFTIYTPGSTAGVPLNVMGSLAPPGLDWTSEAEVIRDEIEGFVSSLLGMAGVEADPIASPEHILLANLVEAAWRAGRTLDLAALIQQVQDPPLRKLGVFEVDAFFPPKDRTALAMRLNGLVASPSFAGWLEGPPLDMPSLLQASDGRPRAAVVYLAHLSDPERQFVVTLVLSKLVTWMRGLSGTTDLRALVYMDEVFGFVPPTAQPPSKKPILTILKQARAFGVGLVLATQNPVDLDYKAMSNAGTWWIGRLQTERDKARILEGLQSAGGGVDTGDLDTMISGLEQRRFVLHNTHAERPVVFQTRWAMSYLRGPLTREQVMALTKDAPERQAAVPAAAEQPPEGEPPTGGSGGTAGPESPATAEAAASAGPDESTVAPQVGEGGRVAYLDPAAEWAGRVGAVPGGTRLRAGLAARVHLRYDDARTGIDHAEEWEAVFFPLGERFDPGQAEAVDYDERDFRAEPPVGAVYELPAVPLTDGRFLRESAAALRTHLVRSRSIEVYANRALKLYSRVGEDPQAFAVRCDTVAQTEADRETARIRDRLEGKKEKAYAALQAAQRDQQQLEAEARARKQEELMSGAGGLLNIFLGGKANTRSMAGMSSRRSATARTEARMKAAHQKAVARYEDLQTIERDLAEEIQEIDARWSERANQIETLEIGLEASDVQVDEMVVVWIPAT